MRVTSTSGVRGGQPVVLAGIQTLAFDFDVIWYHLELIIQLWLAPKCTGLCQQHKLTEPRMGQTSRGQHLLSLSAS